MILFGTSMTAVAVQADTRSVGAKTEVLSDTAAEKFTNADVERAGTNDTESVEAGAKKGKSGDDTDSDLSNLISVEMNDREIGKEKRLHQRIWQENPER